MGLRGARVAETRAKIVEAVVALHEEVGPRATTIKAIAERAGVERLTVYRHFPDEKTLYEACSNCWLEAHPPPDPAGPGEEPGGEARARAILEAMNGYYREGQAMLRQIYRDVGEIPALAEVMTGFRSYLENLAGLLVADWPGTGEDGAWRLEATAFHVLDFRTWELMEEAGLDDPRKLSLQLGWLRGAVAAGR